MIHTYPNISWQWNKQTKPIAVKCSVKNKQKVWNLHSLTKTTTQKSMRYKFLQIFLSHRVKAVYLAIKLCINQVQFIILKRFFFKDWPHQGLSFWSREAIAMLISLIVVSSLIINWSSCLPIPQTAVSLVSPCFFWADPILYIMPK